MTFDEVLHELKCDQSSCFFFSTFILTGRTEISLIKNLLPFTSLTVRPFKHHWFFWRGLLLHHAANSSKIFPEVTLQITDSARYCLLRCSDGNPYFVKSFAFDVLISFIPISNATFFYFSYSKCFTQLFLR